MLLKHPRNVRQPNPSRKTSAGQPSLGFEALEARQLLAFDFLFDGSTLTLTQVADDGIITIANSGPGNAFQVNDGAGLVAYQAADHLVVELMDNTSHLSFAIENPHTGNVQIDAGNGNRSILFVGGSNQIDGDLLIQSGAGDQMLSPAHVNPLLVGGTVEISTDSGNDMLTFLDSFSIGGDLQASNVRNIDVQSGMNLAGSLIVNNTLNEGEYQLEKTSVVPSSIGGDLVYNGHEGLDFLDLALITVDGDVIVDLNDGFTAGVSNQLLALDSMEFDNLFLTSGDNTNVDANIWSSVTANGNIAIDLGEGDNTSILNGVINGDTISYAGQSGVDLVSYAMSGGVSQQLHASLGAGIDSFTLFDGSTLGNLNIDFGGIDDQFVNAWGDFTFDAQLTGLDFFDHVYELATDTLTMSEIPNVLVGDLTVFSDPVTFSFITTGDAITAAKTLNIRLLDGGARNLELVLTHNVGTLNVDLGDGDRTLEFNAPVNIFDDGISISAGAGSQEVFLDAVGPLVSHGELLIDLGQAADAVFSSANGLLVAGDFVMLGVNTFINDGLMGVNGNLILDVSMESEETLFIEQHEMLVSGDMFVYGGGSKDYILFAPSVASTIQGNLYVDLADNLGAGVQLLRLEPNTTIGGNVTMLSTSELNTDVFRSEPGAVIEGNTVVDLGDGNNVGLFRHENLGDLIKFTGGSGVDDVLLDLSGTPATLNFSLGAGDDIFWVEPGVLVGDFLRIDFGGGNDNYTNLLGAFTFDARLLNFRGFSSFYQPGEDSLNIVQVADLGNVAIDNNGPGNTIQLDSDGGSYEITPSSHLRLNLLPNSSLDVAIDLGAPLAGDLTLSLKSGDRDVYFAGASNVVQGDLRIVAADGNQNIHLAENANLSVTGDMVVNLRDGTDMLIDGGNEIHVGGNMILRNVDHLEVANLLVVGGNMTMVSHWYTQDTRLDNDGQLQINGRFTYLGSDGADDVLLSGNVSIGDEIYIDLGDNLTSGLGQDVVLANGFAAAGRVTIHGGTSMAGNTMVTDANTMIDGDFIVDFSMATTPNTAIFNGVYGGDYGTYRGGQARDQVSFDAQAEDMEWASLLHGGDDEYVLGMNAHLLNKYLDFGIGTDQFLDEHIEIFPISVLNLP